MSDQIKVAASKIEALRQDLIADLADLPLLQVRADNVLSSLANGLLHTIGIVATVDTTFEPQPLKRVLGNDIAGKVPLKTEDITPSQADKEALLSKIDAAYPTFRDRTNKDLMETLDDLTIRGIARMAGMDVTANEPEKITSKFITEVKDAIKAKADLDEATQKELED